MQHQEVLIQEYVPNHDYKVSILTPNYRLKLLIELLGEDLLDIAVISHQYLQVPSMVVAAFPARVVVVA